MKIENEIETDYETVVSEGDVVKKSSYHNWEMNCDCDKDAPLAKYRDVVVLYSGKKYYFYHSTAVVIELSDTEYRLSRGGWKTKSTKERINRYIPSDYKIKQRSGNWLVQTPDSELEFTSGMIIHT